MIERIQAVAHNIPRMDLSCNLEYPLQRSLDDVHRLYATDACLWTCLLYGHPFIVPASRVTQRVCNDFFVPWARSTACKLGIRDRDRDRGQGMKTFHEYDPTVLEPSVPGASASLATYRRLPEKSNHESCESLSH
jgi:hypothetical protein